MKKEGKKIIVGCSGGKDIAKKIARKIKAKYCDLISERFPDSELKLKFDCSIKNKEVYFVQSFYQRHGLDINDKFIEILFAGYTAKELGAKKIILIAPYIAYMREDKRFKKGEAISAKILVKLFKIFEKVYIIEPHLHRLKKLSEFFSNAHKISLSQEISDYIKKNIKGNYILVGPDIESEQWVKAVADKLKNKYVILEKTRISSRKVKIKKKEIDAKIAIILDDIISTGKTMIETAKLIKARKVYFIGIHGLFSEDALKKLNKIGKVIVSNTIPSKSSKIDCSNAIVKEIKKN